MYIAVYVDDIIIVSDDYKWIRNVKTELAKDFDIKDLGKIGYCLGINIKQDVEGISMTQEKYVTDLLRRFGMDDCNPVCTPMDKEATFENNKGVENQRRPYRELVGSLMYLAVATRPDIAHAVSVLAQFNDCNTEAHWQAAKRVLRYLKRTSNYGIIFRRSDAEIAAYVDADWGRCKLDRKSYTGYVFNMSMGPICWKSQKQRTVAMSSTEAEYMWQSRKLLNTRYIYLSF